MPRLTIDGRSIDVTPETSVLKAARLCSISIPALCDLDGYEPQASCLVCMVKDEASGRFFPSCATRAQEGMVISTASTEVRRARGEILDLLASEHVGDCESPCRRGCPADIDIDEVLGFLKRGDIEAAAGALFEANPFPAILGRICPAPCERVCRRKLQDEAVSIKLIEKFVGDSADSFRPLLKEKTGKKVAIIGAGPAGLSAAWFLLKSGHSVTVFEKTDVLGGGLGRCVEKGTLPAKILLAETGRIRSMGADIVFNTDPFESRNLDELMKRFDGLLVAVGKIEDEQRSSFSLSLTDRGIETDHVTFETAKRGVFAAGSAVKPHSLAARAITQGRQAAFALDAYLDSGKAVAAKKPFDSHILQLAGEELEIFAHDASSSGRTAADNGSFTRGQALQEAERCFSCACLKRTTCALRSVVTNHCENRRTYLETREPFTRVMTHPEVVFEPSKCIKCGRCVRITEAKKERLGLAFIGHGFHVTIGVPFDEDLQAALTHTAAECVAACPTAALAMRKDRSS